MENKKKDILDELSAEEKQLLEQVRGAFRAVASISYNVAFTVKDTSIDLSTVPGLMIWPRNDGIYAGSVGSEGLEVLKAWLTCDRIGEADPKVFGDMYPRGELFDTCFVVRDKKLNLATVPGLTIRPGLLGGVVYAGEVGADGMRVLRQLHKAGRISLPD